MHIGTDVAGESLDQTPQLSCSAGSQLALPLETASRDEIVLRADWIRSGLFSYHVSWRNVPLAIFLNRHCQCDLNKCIHDRLNIQIQMPTESPEPIAVHVMRLTQTRSLPK